MAGLFGVEWQGYRGPSGRFQRDAEDALGGTLDDLADQLTTLARQEAPIGKPGGQDPLAPSPYNAPGALRAGLHVDQTQHGATGTLTLQSDAPYTEYVLRGRGTVVPQSAHVLRFFVQGHPVFATHVKGVAPNDFVERATLRFEPVLDDRLSRLVAAYTTALLTSDD